MIIAHVLSSFGMGGQERVALDLARGQIAAGHTVIAVSLASSAEGPHAENFRKAGARVFTVPKGRGFDLTLIARLLALFRGERVGVVHTHNPQPLVYAAPAGKLAGAGVVHTKHGANPDNMRRLLLRRVASRFVDAYVAVSATTGALANRNGDCAPHKLEIIPNGIDLRDLSPDPRARGDVRREFGIANDARIVGTVGRLAPEKNQLLLIHALGPVLSESVALMIVGSGPEEERLRAAASALPNGRYIYFTGARQDVGRLLAALDVFALSSTTEGLPLVIPEAMAAALPIVSTKVGGIPDVVEEGKFGFLVESGDADGLRDRISTLLNDPQLAAWMGTRARSVALSRYSATRMVTDYMNLYLRISSGSSRNKRSRPSRGPSVEAEAWTSLRSRLSP